MKLIEKLRLQQERLKALKNKGDEESKKQLDSILNKWTWNKKPIKSAEEFLNKMAPWIDKMIKKDEEWEEFMKNWGIKDLKDITGVEMKTK